MDWRSEPEQVVEFVRSIELPSGTVSERVGNWVWITFQEKPAAEIRKQISDAGFRWINKRGAWAHCCGHVCKHGSGDPKDKYVTETI